MPSIDTHPLTFSYRYDDDDYVVGVRVDPFVVLTLWSINCKKFVVAQVPIHERSCVGVGGAVGGCVHARCVRIDHPDVRWGALFGVHRCGAHVALCMATIGSPRTARIP